jgi:hypothetical protein
MHKPFEQLTLLVDQFYQQVDEPVKRGAKPVYDNAFYMKLYFFGILNRCPEKSRFLERGQKAFPSLFKKTCAKHRPATFVVNRAGRPAVLAVAASQTQEGEAC